MLHSEDKLLLAKFNDLARMCGKYQEPVFSSFLDGAGLVYIKDNFLCPAGCDMLLFGGYEDAERKLACVFPDWYDASYVDFPITALQVVGGVRRALTHRDYLGVLMSLGIKREKIGDILTYEGGAYIFLAKDIAPFAAANITKVANEGVKITEISLCDVSIPEKKTERIETVCASMRLDAVLAAALRVSRRDAAGLVSGGMVRVNYREALDGSKNISDNDLLSVKGFGRFRFGGALGATRKERLHIVLYKYI